MLHLESKQMHYLQSVVTLSTCGWSDCAMLPKRLAWLGGMEYQDLGLPVCR